MTTSKRSPQKKTRLKVHFMADVAGDKTVYQQIYDLILELGYDIVTDHILKRDIKQVEEEEIEEAKRMYKKLQEWIHTADIVVYEVSRPCVSTGYEVASAFKDFKPAILLYNVDTGEVPHGIKGLENELLLLRSYTKNSLQGVLTLALKQASAQVSKRIGVDLSLSLMRYLDWLNRAHQMNHSVYIRGLIEDDMQRNLAYQLHLKN